MGRYGEAVEGTRVAGVEEGPKQPNLSRDDASTTDRLWAMRDVDWLRGREKSGITSHRINAASDWWWF